MNARTVDPKLVTHNVSVPTERSLRKKQSLFNTIALVSIVMLAITTMFFFAELSSFISYGFTFVPVLFHVLVLCSLLALFLVSTRNRDKADWELTYLYTQVPKGTVENITFIDGAYVVEVVGRNRMDEERRDSWKIGRDDYESEAYAPGMNVDFTNRTE
jgi:hypothetical protein